MSKLTKRALVTGASEGIGKEFAIQLADAGYEVTCVARNEEKLRSLIDQLAFVPDGDHHFIVADLSTEQGIQRIGKELEKTHYNILINNAGVGQFGKFAEIPLTKFQEMMALNCNAVVELCHHYLNRAKKGDALINVASTAAFHPLPFNGLYAATKAFVLSFTEMLAFEQKERGIYAMALCPGYTLTEFNKRAGISGDDTTAFRKFAQSAESVVSEALRELRSRKKTVVITGPHNKALTQVQRFMPRDATVRLAGKTFEKFLSGSGL